MVQSQSALNDGLNDESGFLCSEMIKARVEKPDYKTIQAHSHVSNSHSVIFLHHLAVAPMVRHNHAEHHRKVKLFI